MTTLVFPAGMPESLSYLEAARRRGEHVIGFSSPPDDTMCLCIPTNKVALRYRRSIWRRPLSSKWKIINAFPLGKTE